MRNWNNHSYGRTLFHTMDTAKKKAWMVSIYDDPLRLHYLKCRLVNALNNNNKKKKIYNAHKVKH